MGNQQFQKRTSLNKRATARLGSALDKRLVSYAATATAAGVSLLALTPVAEGKIVYTKRSTEIGPKKVLHLDLNNDRTADFKFSNLVHTNSGSHTFSERLMIKASARNGVFSSATVLPPGVQIGPKGRFQKGSQLMVKYRFIGGCTTFRSTEGGWNNITDGYMGLKFYIKGEVHYGWARLNVTVAGDYGIYALLTGCAYETVANKPIVTGKTKDDYAGQSAESSAMNPATLGALARGAAGIAIWRRRNTPGK